jgi:RecA/RadA recombinase
MKYCEQRVRVTGKVIRRGSERGIVIDSVAAYLPGAEPESPRADRGKPTDR